MRELLERWASLEPERCQVYDERASVMTDVGGPLERPRFTAQFHRLGQYEPHILAAVIEAVEVRGGEWMLRAGPNLWVAGVSRTAGNDAYWDGHGDSRESATHALLAAYVAALEAEAGQ